MVSGLSAGWVVLSTSVSVITFHNVYCVKTVKCYYSVNALNFQQSYKRELLLYDYFSFRKLRASFLFVTCVGPTPEVPCVSEPENCHTIQKSEW